MVILLPGHDEAETDIQKIDTMVMYGMPKSRLEEHIRNLKAKTFRAVHSGPGVVLKKKVILSQVSSKTAALLATDGLVRRTNVSKI